MTGSGIDELYAWQAEALDSWRSRGRHGIVEAVTGTGKTKVGINYGENKDKKGNVSAVLDGELKNKSYTLGMYHSLNKFITLVGEFNDWDPQATPLVRVGPDGPWVATVWLPPGRHVYGFVLDGAKWVADPWAPLAPDDGFGTPASVRVVDRRGML